MWFFQTPLCACADTLPACCRGQDTEDINVDDSSDEQLGTPLVQAHPLEMTSPDPFPFGDEMIYDDSTTDTESTTASTADTGSTTDPDEPFGKKTKTKKKKMSPEQIKQAQRAFNRKLRACTDLTVRRLWASFPMFEEADVRQALKENDDHEGDAHIQLLNLAQQQQGEPHMQLYLAQHRRSGRYSLPCLPSVPSGSAL